MVERLDPRLNDEKSNHWEFYQKDSFPEPDETAEDWVSRMDNSASKVRKLPVPGSREWLEEYENYWGYPFEETT